MLQDFLHTSLPPRKQAVRASPACKRVTAVWSRPCFCFEAGGTVAARQAEDQESRDKFGFLQERGLVTTYLPCYGIPTCVRPCPSQTILRCHTHRENVPVDRTFPYSKEQSLYCSDRRQCHASTLLPCSAEGHCSLQVKPSGGQSLSVLVFFFGVLCLWLVWVVGPLKPLPSGR